MAPRSTLRPDGTKKCTHCDEYFPLSQFYTSGKKRNGDPKYNSWCQACIKAKQASYHQRKWGEEMLQRSAYKRAKTVETYLMYLLGKARARSGGEVELEVSDLVRLWFLQGGRCALTGWEMTRSLGKGSIATNASIDRVDSSKGYVRGNVQLVCRATNTAKSNLTTEDFVALCRAVVEKADGKDSCVAA